MREHLAADQGQPTTSLLIARASLFTMIAVLQESKFDVLVLSYMSQKVSNEHKVRLNGMDERDS